MEDQSFEGKIVSFKITPKGAKFMHTDNVNEQNEMTYKEKSIKVDRKISQNFDNMLRLILGHALIFTGMEHGKIDETAVKNRRIVDMPAFKSYKVTGFNIKGDGEDEKLTVGISVTNIKGTTVNFNSAPIPLGKEDYKYTSLLLEDFGSVINECRNYIAGKNYFVQGDLFKEPKKETEKTKAKNFDQF